MNTPDQGTELFRPLMSHLDTLASRNEMALDRRYLSSAINGLIELYSYSAARTRKGLPRSSIEDDDLYELLGVYATCMKSIYREDFPSDHLTMHPLVIIYEIINGMILSQDRSS
ncbi:hypothetical protein, partial [Mesorhizobium sp. M4B.F.Ca.ET.089.01.1.1]|uniref:hypothetical protein n=1 Tax=Mesorhizobium sp. M4B.F.Ca.ET.089.01.1.1 TaxID=2496662 RepID=UPI001AECDF9B